MAREKKVTPGSIIRNVKNESRTLLTEIESKELLEFAGIPVIETRLAKSKKEAVEISREIGFPVSLKIVSPEITHKSDTGGVKLELKEILQVEKAYDEILFAVKNQLPHAKIDGISVQKMAAPGVEVVVGMTLDAQFGPILMFGLGGVWVEILKDVTFRIVPLDRNDARKMIHEIKGFPLLNGYRGRTPADMSCLEDLLLNLSEFVDTYSEIKEIDINPIIAYSDSAVAVDARVILSN